MLHSKIEKIFKRTRGNAQETSRFQNLVSRIQHPTTLNCIRPELFFPEK